MEWIRINQNKLKIMLSRDDATKYALCPETASLGDAATRRAFREILSATTEDVGIDFSEDRVYIQLFPSKEGGCELFVTKMGTREQELKKQDQPLTPKSSFAASRRICFCFWRQRDLLSSCRRLLRRGFVGESQAMRDDNGRFWLFLFDRGSPLLAREEFGFLLEYGQMENSADAFLLLLEHGSTLCISRAVETLGVL